MTGQGDDENDVPAQSPAEVEQRLRAGEWLRIGDLMILFGHPGHPKSRSMVDRWLRHGVKFGSKRMVIRYKLQPDGTRECMPEDVLAALAETRKIRSADDPEGVGETRPPAQAD